MSEQSKHHQNVESRHSNSKQSVSSDNTHTEESFDATKLANPEHILYLQRTIGNQATQALLARHKLATQKSSPTTSTKIVNPKRQSETSDQEQQIESEDELQEHTNQADGLISASPPNDQPSGENTVQRQPAPDVAVQGQAPQQNNNVQRGWFGDIVEGGAEWAFEKALDAAGVSADMVMGFLKKAGSMFMSIIENPGGFLGNLIGGLKQGFSNFAGNILTHLKTGFMEWLFGTMTKAGIQLPETFDMKSILTLVMQIIGVTAENIKARLAKVIGEKNVQHIEKGWSIISKFMTDGIGGIWEMLKENLTNLKDMVIGEIKSWLITTIIKNAVIKIASMFNPVSGLVSIISMIYNVIRFVMERGKQIAALVQAVVSSVASIASGNVAKMADKIEQVLARAIPVAVGFFSRLIGLGGISAKVKSIIQKVKQPVDKAIDKMIIKVSGAVKKLLGRGKGDTKADTSQGKEAQVQAGLNAIDKEEQKYLNEGTISKEGAEKVAESVKKKHPVFTSISVKDGGDSWDYDYSVQRAIKPGEKKRLPKTGGQWIDDAGKPCKRGEGYWISDKKVVQQYAQDKGFRGIPFVSAYPNFVPWAVATVRINMTGKNYSDFKQADEALAELWAARDPQTYRNADGSPNRQAIEQYRKGRYTWHHHQNGRSMILVPMKLHSNVPHSGGASIARNS